MENFLAWLGSQAIRVVEILICSVVGLFRIVRNAFAPEKVLRTRESLRKYAACNAITALVIGGATAKLISGSATWTGVRYSFLSLELHLINASEGAWTDQKINLFHAIEGKKAILIASNKFAGFLSDLAGHGIAAKALQWLIGLLCIAIAIGLALLFFRCVGQALWAIQKSFRARRAA